MAGDCRVKLVSLAHAAVGDAAGNVPDAGVTVLTDRIHLKRLTVKSETFEPIVAGQPFVHALQDELKSIGGNAAIELRD